MASVFLDLYGVLVDPAAMLPGYRSRQAEILSRTFGGTVARWAALHDEAWDWYQEEGRRIDALPDERRDGPHWVDAVNDFERRHIIRLFERAGIPVPEDPESYSRELEREVVRGIDALYPGVHPGLRALREDGHRLFVSTNATASNGESALVGGGIRELFDQVFCLENAQAKKDRAHYWRRAFALSEVEPREAVVVDDVARFLAPAAELGATCVQMIRPDRRKEARGGWPVVATLEELRGLLAA